jgi:hypothetical protein
MLGGEGVSLSLSPSPKAMHRATIILISCCLSSLALALGGSAAENASPAGAEAPLAYVTVVGAPGDGEQALAAALTKRLLAVGVKLATTLQTNVYDVQATVRLAPAPGGKQSVHIVWVIFSPDGDQLGVVSQTKEVRKGSLDSKWGVAADAAAGAAVDEILKLLPH